MKIYTRGRFWFTVLILVLALTFISVSFSYSAKARVMPLLVGIPTLILCVLLLIGERYPRLIGGFDVSLTNLVSKDSEVASRFKTAGDNGSGKAVLATYGWMCGYFIFSLLVGFLIATPIYTFLYLKIYWRIGWLKSLVISIVLGGIIYGGFEVLMRADLFKGILFGAITPPI